MDKACAFGLIGTEMRGLFASMSLSMQKVKALRMGNYALFQAHLTSFKFLQ